MAERPFLAAAFLCERVLIEKDDVLTIVRIVDTLTVSIPANIPPGTKPVIQMTGLVSFKKAAPGVEAERHTAELRVRLPSDKDQPTSTMDFVFKPDDVAGANLIVNMQLAVEEFGLYRLAVLLDGELMTQIPFKLLEKPADSPEMIH
jgi:hypothetical protein